MLLGNESALRRFENWPATVNGARFFHRWNKGLCLDFLFLNESKGLGGLWSCSEGNEWGFDQDFLRKYYFCHSWRIHFPLFSWSLKSPVTPFPLKVSSSPLICLEHKRCFCEHKVIGDKSTQLHFQLPSCIDAVLRFIFLLLAEKEHHNKLLRWHLKFRLATAANRILEESIGISPFLAFAIFQNKRKQQYLQIGWASGIVFTHFPSKSLNSWRTKW